MWAGVILLGMGLAAVAGIVLWTRRAARDEFNKRLLEADAEEAQRVTKWTTSFFEDQDKARGRGMPDWSTGNFWGKYGEGEE